MGLCRGEKAASKFGSSVVAALSHVVLWLSLFLRLGVSLFSLASVSLFSLLGISPHPRGIRSRELCCLIGWILLVDTLRRAPISQGPGGDHRFGHVAWWLRCLSCFLVRLWPYGPLLLQLP